MNQTLAIFLDAYRELNARKLFWVTLALTAAMVAAFAVLGIGTGGVTVFGATIPVTPARYWYNWAFSYIMVGLWAKWAALILALVSTASIFPDLLASGSIDLYLSRPIGRLRLFLTKYATGLLFALLQVVVFAAGSFLVFGLRGHEWKPGLFLAIPLVLLLYSYLFCFCVLVGVLTRSPVTSILLTVLFWLICFGVNAAESVTFGFKTSFAAAARAYDKQVRQADAELRELRADHSVTNLFGFRERHIIERRDRDRTVADGARESAERWALYHRIAFPVATLVPKTGETVDLLDRTLFNEKDVEEVTSQKLERAESRGRGPFAGAGAPATIPATGPAPDPAEALALEQEDAREREERQQIAQDTAEEATRAARGRNTLWVIGTSLGFEVAVVAWAAWVFCRRDY